MSDQEDFFFDEEEKPAEPKKAAAPRPKAPAKAATGTTAPRASAPVSVKGGVTMAVAGLIAVCALLVGVIVGILIGGSNEVPTVNSSPAASSTGGQTAPELSSDQLNSGQLPEGHPSIASSSTAGSGSGSGTGK